MSGLAGETKLISNGRVHTPSFKKQISPSILRSDFFATKNGSYHLIFGAIYSLSISLMTSLRGNLNRKEPGLGEFAFHPESIIIRPDSSRVKQRAEMEVAGLDPLKSATVCASFVASTVDHYI